MRAILLAAGFGTRLRPLTDTTPKCLVPIKGTPLLGIWLQRLSQAGIGPFLVNTSYLADLVENFFEASSYREQVTLVHERELLGTAGTLIENLDFFRGEDGLLIHADNYCLADFSAFKHAHLNRPRGCMMTMMTFRTEQPELSGIIEINDQGIVISFKEKDALAIGNLANGAIYMLSPEALNLIKINYAEAKEFSV